MILKPVLKLRKQALDVAETNLAQAKYRQEQARQNVLKAQSAFNGLHNLRINHPRDLQLYSEYAALLRDNLSEAKQKLNLCDKEIVHYEHLYKRANLEHEKIAVLIEQEELAKRTLLAKKEAKELDEIATMLLARAR